MSSRKFFAAPIAVFALGSSLALGFVTSPAVPAHADPIETINLSEIDVDQFPVCVQEDCSDQPNQVGMWLDKDTGNWYLELGEVGTTYLVIDDTVAFARALCPQGEDNNGAIPRALNCQMWIAGTVGDDNHDGLVSEDESGWDDVRRVYR